MLLVKEVFVRLNEEEEVRNVWMADPFPDEKVRYSKVHPSIEVEIEEEEEEEGRIVTDDASTFTFVSEDVDVMVMD